MQPAENKDYSRDVILRLSPTRNTIIVEEQKPGGIAAYREIDPLELYYVINQSYASNDYLDSGFLPEHCLHLSMSATEKYFVLWNPELRADVIYGDREYPNFPIPRMVFGVRVLENGKVAECSMGVVADEAPTMDMKSWRISAAVRTTGCSAVIISCWTMRWMCRAAAEKRRSFLSSTSDAQTASRSKPSASISCGEWRQPN